MVTCGWQIARNSRCLRRQAKVRRQVGCAHQQQVIEVRTPIPHIRREGERALRRPDQGGDRRCLGLIDGDVQKRRLDMQWLQCPRGEQGWPERLAIDCQQRDEGNRAAVVSAAGWGHLRVAHHHDHPLARRDGGYDATELRDFRVGAGPGSGHDRDSGQQQDRDRDGGYADVAGRGAFGCNPAQRQQRCIDRQAAVDVGGGQPDRRNQRIHQQQPCRGQQQAGLHPATPAPDLQQIQQDYGSDGQDVEGGAVGGERHRQPLEFALMVGAENRPVILLELQQRRLTGHDMTEPGGEQEQKKRDGEGDSEPQRTSRRRADSQCTLSAQRIQARQLDASDGDAEQREGLQVAGEKRQRHGRDGSEMPCPALRRTAQPQCGRP
jgi:hypothetical protein